MNRYQIALDVYKEWGELPIQEQMKGQDFVAYCMERLTGLPASAPLLVLKGTVPESCKKCEYRVEPGSTSSEVFCVNGFEHGDPRCIAFLKTRGK